MILVIDNYDSFVHNLARYITLAGADEVRVVRNDQVSVDEIAALSPAGIVLSPGPCTPAEAGICVEAVQRLGETIPILGVCLGHQAIGEAYGGTTQRSEEPVHGKDCEIIHDGSDIFIGLPRRFRGGRYHSLVTKLPENSPLRVTARNPEGIIMAVQHEKFPVYGVQFHPESVLTEHGLELVRNFVALTQNRRAEAA